jgi:hypothetical protein|tara:strand:- start:35 stop:481 length:447 start_codon:yes stop_codon:yes gene_type:complete
MAYRTARKKIANALTEKIKLLDGNHPYNSNVSNNVSSKLVFLDEIIQYPKICVVTGAETREYQPNAFKWRFLQISIRAYVHNENDAQEELSLLFEDIERVIDENDTLMYDGTISPPLSTTNMVIQSITTDEGALSPLAIGEMSIEVRY